jgi:predicted nucleotidyltransferase
MPQKRDNLPGIESDRRPIDLLFGSGVRVDVLWCLMQNPSIGLELSEIISATGRSRKEVKRAIVILEKLGLVRRLKSAGGVMARARMHVLFNEEWLDEKGKRNGRTRYFLNEDHPWIKPLRQLLESTVGSIDIIRSVFRDIAGIEVAFVFGSFAISEQGPESDIDLLVVGDHDQSSLFNVISGLEEKVAREVQLVVYTPDEWRKGFEERSHFVVSLMEAPKIFIIGNFKKLYEISTGTPQ